MNIRKIGLAAALCFVFCFTLGVGTASAFNQNNLIDDYVFNDFNSMNSGQIDSFLNSFPTSCISPNRGFASRIPNGYSPSGGYTYGSNGTAGQVIAAAAQAYDINPQVLLTTLQKEQALVTGAGGCSTQRLSKAAGYGCPDNYSSHDYSGLNLFTLNGTTYTSVEGICVNSASKAGFSQQVIRAAWLLKFAQQRSMGNVGWAVIEGGWDNSDDPKSCYSGPMTEGTHKTCPNGTESYFDGYRTIDGSPVHMDTGATAALYWYTPHFHGNQNFVSIFTGWFGGTTGPNYGWRVEWQAVYADKARTQRINDTDNVTYVAPGQRVYVRLWAQNVGRWGWSKDVRLATSGPRDRISAFRDPNWMSDNRVFTFNEWGVPPGKTGIFDFPLTAPSKPGVHNEQFNLVNDAVSWFNDARFTIPINVVTPVNAPNDPTTNMLDSTAKTTLKAGDYLLSSDRNSALWMQTDGNLELIVDHKPVWSSKTAGLGATKAVLQADGNLVLYRANGQAVWGSGTDGHGNVKLIVQDDGNLVMYKTSDGQAVWGSETRRYGASNLHVNFSLRNNRRLLPGQILETPDRKYKLTLQHDGNLVIYSPYRALWGSGTQGKTPGHLVMQGDGNLVIYDKWHKPIWGSGTNGRGASQLFMQTDGNLVIYNSHGPTWGSDTAGRQ